jgi:hypothetical protein
VVIFPVCPNIDEWCLNINLNVDCGTNVADCEQILGFVSNMQGIEENGTIICE